MQDIRPIKRDLREKYKAIRKEMTGEKKEKLDSKIANKTLNLWRYRESPLILIYVSTPIEVDTAEIIRQSLLIEKTVAAPRCVDGTRDMDFYVIKSFDDLQKGAFGVMEPLAEKCEKLTSFDNAICVVPALSFDRDGYRLGYGKGYYDRFLSNFSGDTLGLCYSECVSEDPLPHGKFDKKISMIISENYILTTD